MTHLLGAVLSGNSRHRAEARDGWVPISWKSRETLNAVERVGPRPSDGLPRDRGVGALAQVPQVYRVKKVFEAEIAGGLMW
jgi:hypothetical protein